MDKVRVVEAEQITEGRETFKVGDTVRVHYRIVEGKTERIQVFEGLVISIKNGGLRRSFTVRKISYGVGVERSFPLHSPRIEKIETVRRGRVRRAKLYYIRDRVGKAAKVAELRKTRSPRAARRKATARNTVEEGPAGTTAEAIAAEATTEEQNTES